MRYGRNIHEEETGSESTDISSRGRTGVRQADCEIMVSSMLHTPSSFPILLVFRVPSIVPAVS